LPSVCVATQEFRDAAERQSKALGADVASVFVSHPIQDRTDEELREIADAFAGDIVAALLRESA